MDKNFSEKAAPRETPFGKSFLSYTEDGKVGGRTGKILDYIAQKAKPKASISRAAVGPLAAALDIIPAFNKYSDQNPTAGLAEVATSPEGSEALAKGISAAIGSELGGVAGSSLPVPAASKPATALTGAILGAMAGSKLGELLTGNSSIDKIIKAVYEKQLREREANMVKDFRDNSSIEVQPLSEFTPSKR
jgi:hypothetical protein